MNKYHLGHKISVMYIDECMYVVDQSMKELAERLEIEAAPKLLSSNFDKCKYNKGRQIESNDWRRKRKGKRGFNGYHKN